MGKIYDVIDDELRTWIAAQSLFFVGTAPLSGSGHVNVSPKGPIGSLRVTGPTSVAYLDILGSGAETLAHLRENGRIVIMLCAFQGAPKILRLHGRGTIVMAGDARFDALLAKWSFEDPGIPEARRAVIEVDVIRIATACGYGVPLMGYEGGRSHAVDWGEKKLRDGGVAELAKYRRAKNSTSIDGLPAVDVEEHTDGEA
ncbi:MAG: pyridoxamine 5-phosphate oxidase-related FMN-binding protein [Myxococcaceae bacterium]|nr:pyridoxamine 5-phosphate oxidase-related FMN-binding protein [Myxococcaceae bacterium]